MTKRVQRKLASFLLIVQLFFSFFAPFSPFIGRLTAQDQSSPANFSEFNTESLEFDYKDGQLIVDSNQQQLDYSYYYLHQDVTQAEQGRLSFGENSLFVGTESNGHFIDHDFELMIFKAQRGGKTYAHYLQKQDTELEVLQVVGSDDLELSDDELDWLKNYEVQELSAETLSTVSTQKSVEWEVDETSQTAVTKDNVRLNVEYIFPLEEAVTVTFTKLPAEEADRSNLRIARVRVDELNLPDDFKTDAEYAYDITTEMENGTFEYDLSLPKTGQKDDEVSYIEKSIDEVKAGVGEHDIKKVEQSKIKAQDEVVKVTALDHLTLFIAGGGAEMRVTGSLDGQAQVTVNPGQSIRVDLEVSGGSGDVWRSSSWQVQGESLNCVDHQDHDVSSGSANQSFDITAPGSNGTYDVSFAAYTGDTCDSGASNTFTLTDGIIVDSGYTIPEVSYTYDADDPIAFKSVTGVWTSVNGGSNVTGVNTEEVRWGTSAGYGQSGLRFDGSGLQSFDTGDTFYLGALTHFNFPIYNAADGATLKITLEFEKPDVSPNPEFSFYFEINETPNVAGECPEWQISDTPCDDMITFPSIDETKSFEIEDRLYTLKIEGFVDSYPDGDPVQHFITEENLASTAFLVGSLSSVLIEEPGISIKKKTNNIDVTGAPGPELYVGDTVTWQYIVQNIGNVKLTDINVTDDQEGGVTCPKTTLQPGEDMTCEITDGVVTVGQYENKATVVADHSSGTVTGEDTSWYFGVYHKGSIKIVKNTTGGDDTFNFTSNFGVSSLTTVDGTASQTISDLIAGSSYSISETVPTGWSLDSASCDRGTINAIEVVHGQTTTCTFENTKLDPVIQVVKSSTTTSITTAGQVVPYTFTVTNEGNTTLTGITVTDPNCDAVPVYQSGDTNTNENLDVNETWIYTCSHTVTQGEIDTGGNLVNEVTVDSNETEPVTDDHFIPITQSPALSIVKSGKFNDENADGYADVGETISYTFSVTNDGNVTLTNVTVTDPLVTVTGGPTTLDVGETDTTTFTASYTITQADIDAGKVDNTATADSVESSPATDDEIVTLSQDAKLSIDKTATPSTYDSVGDVITYEFLVTNTGNLTLYDIYVVDDKAIDESCPDTNGGLAPNDQITCTASYTIDQADLNNGFVTNIAYATDGDIESARDSATVTSIAGRIIIEKQTLPDGSSQLFEFNPSWIEDNFSLSDGQSEDSGWLAPGQYAVEELVPAGWDLTSIICSDPTENSGQSPTAASVAEIDLGPNELVTCVFTNIQRGEIIVEKQVLPDGHNQTFSFSGDLTGTIGDGGQLMKEVVPGAYDVSESMPFTLGYQLISIVCDDSNSAGNVQTGTTTFNVEPGETVKCTFTNEMFGSITAHKYHDLNQDKIKDDDEPGLGGWQIHFYDAHGCEDGDNFWSGTTDSDGNLTRFSLVPGQYSVSETLEQGWDNTTDVCQNITVNPGQDVIVNFGNIELGSILVHKFEDKNANGEKDSADNGLPGWEMKLFEGSSCTGDYKDIENTDSNGNHIFSGLLPGQYSVQETIPTVLDAQFGQYRQWFNTTGGVCRDVSVLPGQQANIEFGNFLEGFIVACKFNDLNGDGVKNSEDNGIKDWTLYLQKAGRDVITGITRNDGCYIFTNLTYGTYTLSEDETDTAWMKTYPSGNHTLPILSGYSYFPGDNTNFLNFEKVSITACKESDPDALLETTAGRFPVDNWQMELLKDGEVINTQYTNEPESDGCYTWNGLEPGNYSVREEQRDNWMNLTDTTHNFGIVQSGETYSHTFVNTELGKIIIEKQTLPDGSSQLFEFNPSWIEDNFSLSDGQSEDSGWLAPGQYTVEEIVPAGWDLTDISCSEDGEENSSIIESGADLILEAGETITCTFTNTQRAQVRVHKFDDEYISGQFDDGDELLAGWDMTIISQADEFSQTETTQMNNGSYAPAAFSLIPGDYTLSETLQDGWEQSAMYCELLAVGQVPFINQVLGINQVLAQEVSEGLEVEESQQQSDSIDLTVNPGDNINCYVGNYQLGSIYGDKYFDADQDGQYDGGEITLSDWEITLIDGEDQLITQTDANGRYSFENLTAGTYTVCEQDRTAEGWQATEPSGQLCREVVINQSGQQAPANFGNYINSLLLIEKTNNVWPNDQETGDEVTYTIQIMADEGPVYGVRVFDLLPEQFEYIAGSFTAKSSTGADLKANGITTEPNYASPGVWELGDLVKDEIVTLTYRAVIGDDIDPGIYPDMVWALGTSAEDYVANQETTDNLLALSDPNFTASVEGVDFDGSQGHYGEDYFAGTQVAVVTDQTPSSRYQIERTEEKEGEVLGTATELPATGARFWLTILAFFSILSGAGLLLWPKFARRFSGKLLLIAAALGTSLFMAQSVHALSSVRLGEPYNASDQFNQDAITNQTDFKIDFVVLNTDNLSVEAQCQQRQDGGSWSDITTSYTVKAGGNSGICEVSGLSNQSQYDFRVRVTGDGDPEYSNLVRVDLDTDKPKQPVSYKKTKDGDCAYEIEFKTADDDRTTRVEVYRTSNSERLSANADTRIADISIGPDETHVFSTSKPNCDKDYYYAIRAFDQYNNASDLIGDKEIVTIIVEPSEETIAAAEAEAAMELAALPVSDVGAADVFLIPDEEMVDEEMPDDEVDEDMEEVTLETEEEEVEGQVLGEAVETFWSVLRRWALPLGIGIIILLAVYFLFIAKKNEK